MKIRVVAGVALGAALVVPSAASAATAPELSGAAVYAGTGQLSRYEGEQWSTLAKVGAMPQFAASPDGKKAAWVTAGGKLQVKEGGKTVTVATKLQGGTPCLTPVWSPDSTQVAYVGKGDAVMAVKSDGTKSRRLGVSKGVCHLAWAAGGRYLAGYTGEADAVYRLDVKTGKSVRAKGVKLVTHVQSLSPNGRDAVVEFPANPEALGDGSWPTAFKPTVVDLVTGKKLTPAVKGKLIGAFYLADGRLVVRVAGSGHNTLVVLDAAGKETQRVQEPAKARNQALLQVLP
ncbi:MAG: hypothetical protein HOV96_07655 [Nonomuraea sp.]|nr:hypothetical protein [Nonomuraea sp.]NUP63759.1 hypothetical protein [Nonomuraea sp.]NUP77409.1 hypothetical protein [Nonomuraea sp.]NUS08331.1 hypothetical protein [Nonomuraea sp.]NUT10064.1 hypothetical protein [Nonomuraea sp.]